MNENRIRKLIEEAISDVMIKFATILLLDKIKDDIVKEAQQDLIKKIDECMDKMPIACFDSDAFLEFYEKLKKEVEK